MPNEDPEPKGCQKPLTLKPLVPKQGVTLSDQVYDTVLQMIVKGEFAEGERLPTEADFCRRFAVSRTVVREALSRLKFDGLIVSRQGQGSVVARRPKQEVLQFAPVGSIADVQQFFEFRKVIESDTAALAAERRSEADLRRLVDAFEALDASFVRGDMAIEEDLAFHLCVAECAHNRYLASVVRSASDNFRVGMKFARELTVGSYQSRSELTQGEHRDIVTAISNGDAAAARAAMSKHLDNTRARIFDGS